VVSVALASRSLSFCDSRFPIPDSLQFLRG
jgi:hypothetical protein